MALSVDYLWTGYGHDEVKVFQYVINKSDMITFTDDMYCYDISYPDFMYPAEDNADGANRFNYNGRTDLMVETTVIDSIQYLKQNSDKIIQERDCVYIDGPRLSIPANYGLHIPWYSTRNSSNLFHE